MSRKSLITLKISKEGQKQKKVIQGNHPRANHLQRVRTRARRGNPDNRKAISVISKNTHSIVQENSTYKLRKERQRKWDKGRLMINMQMLVTELHVLAECGQAFYRRQWNCKRKRSKYCLLEGGSNFELFPLMNPAPHSMMWWNIYKDQGVYLCMCVCLCV